MFINNFDPVAFTFLSLEIRWYSLAYIFGILIGWIYCKNKISNSQNLKEKFDDYVTYLIIAIILGGRIGYVVIYNPSYYINNLSDVIKVWNGGMSFHGAVIGIIIINYFYTKKNNLNYFAFLDYISLAAPIGVFLGRLANFVNSELYGKETSFFLSVKFEIIDDLYRHPSQIYEAFFEGIILFILLNFILKRFIIYKGYISGLFLIFYSFFRFLIEFTREPDQHLGYLFLNLTMGQILSLIFFTTGLFILYSKNLDEK